MDKTIKILLKKKLKAFENFHQFTKLRSLPKSVHTRFWPKEWKTIYYKEYPRFDKIVLPSPYPSKYTLVSSLMQRESIRNFNKEPFTLEQISNLLFYSVGERKLNTPNKMRRFYPSAGARYPLEVYIFSLNSDLPEGIYHYNVRLHCLEILLKKKLDLKKIMVNYPWIFDASIIVVITGVFQRNTMKYGDRGYRHILIEAGHVGQNFYLNASSYQLGISAVGGYRESELETLLDVDGIDESILYVLALGNK